MISLKRLVALFFITMLSCVAHGQILPRDAAQGDVVILATVTFPKGKGCVWVTGKTKFPLSHEECNRFAEENGQPFPVDHRRLWMPIIKDAIFFEGQSMVYVFTSRGNGWVAVDQG